MAFAGWVILSVCVEYMGAAYAIFPGQLCDSTANVMGDDGKVDGET